MHRPTKREYVRPALTSVEVLVSLFSHLSCDKSDPECFFGGAANYGRFRDARR